MKSICKKYFYEVFESWWNTEPFGYDNTDTKKGIENILNFVISRYSDRIHVLEKKIKKLKELNDVLAVNLREDYVWTNKERKKYDEVMTEKGDEKINAFLNEPVKSMRDGK